MKAVLCFILWYLIGFIYFSLHTFFPKHIDVRNAICLVEERMVDFAEAEGAVPGSLGVLPVLRGDGSKYREHTPLDSADLLTYRVNGDGSVTLWREVSPWTRWFGVECSVSKRVDVMAGLEEKRWRDALRRGNQ